MSTQLQFILCEFAPKRQATAAFFFVGARDTRARQFQVSKSFRMRTSKTP